MILYLVRHGAAEGAAGRCIGSRTDLPLSVSGAGDVAGLFSEWDAPPGRLISSDLLRARHSADVLAREWDCEVETDPRLREMDFGEWDGRAWDDLEAADGERLGAWMADWAAVRAPGGESFADVIARAAAWAAELPRGETIVAVAHAGSIRALLCHLLDLPPERAFRFRVDPARASAVRIGSVGAEALFVNAGHVPAP